MKKMNGFIEHVKYKEELNKAVLFQNYFTFSTLKFFYDKK